MAKKSISEILNFSLIILDLDNTIYNEEDYLLQAYSAISERFADFKPGKGKRSLLRLITGIYRKEGRQKLFDKFLEQAGIEPGYLSECLEILRGFTPEKQIKLYRKTRKILRILEDNQKQVYVLTNGNPGQQRNKIRSLDWDGLDEKITFIMADEIEPKPSPAGINYILRIADIGRDQALFIGDSEIDRECALNGGIRFLNIKEL